MVKLYAGIGLVLLLGIAFWYHGNQREEAGVNSERVKWQSKYLEAQQELDVLRSQAEKTIIEERVVYRDRIKTIRETINECIIPDDILRVLADSGIYTGEVGAVRPTDIQ